MKRHAVTLLAAVLALAGCSGEGTDAGSADAASADAMEPATLGPADGHELPPTDLERVAIGDLAPDFTLASLAGPNVTLSDYRGEKDVVLVFYRGHW